MTRETGIQRGKRPANELHCFSLIPPTLAAFALRFSVLRRHSLLDAVRNISAFTKQLRVITVRTKYLLSLLLPLLETFTQQCSLDPPTNLLCIMHVIGNKWLLENGVNEHNVI